MDRFISQSILQKGLAMPKGVNKNAEDIVKSILDKQKEQIRKIQQRNREKLKKLNAIVAKQNAARRTEAGAQLEKLYKEQAASLDIKKVIALCEKYWPTQKESKDAKAGASTAAA
jgi:hypothetical protein